MIPVREVLGLRDEWQLRPDVIEKDWALGWILAAIAAEPELSSWIFKGGTSLRKCYYETYRFSEDLDFTVVSGGPEQPERLVEIFGRVALWLSDAAGLELVVDDQSFVRRRNRRGNETTAGRLAYRGPTNPPMLPKLKIDLTSDELVVNRPVLREILNPYSDAPSPSPRVACYSIVDLMSEKLRALAQRCRPRDLYDVVHLFRHPDLLGRAPEVAASLARKCEFVGIASPDLASIRATPFRIEVESEWANMLDHQLPGLPPFDKFWVALDEVFGWLDQSVPVPDLPRAEVGALDPGWRAPRSMTSWRTGAPLELVRFAGANRLKAEIDYRAEQGRRGRRVVEPYALRRTRAGNVVLVVVNDYGQLRSYRTDRISGVSVTRESFVPRYRMEF